MSAPWPDFSRGFPPAQKGDYLDHKKRLYHNRCGKSLTMTGIGWTCNGGCNVGYTHEQMRKFDDDAMATRFHVRPETEQHEALTIVWKVDPITKKMYSCLVPTEEAHKYERFDYYDVK